MRTLRRALSLAPAALVFALLGASAAGALADGTDAVAASLRTRYTALQEQLGKNEFRRPLTLRSSETADAATGDIHALVDSQFEAAGAALVSPGDWCDILLLHINTKTCRVSAGVRGTVLSLWIGEKHDQPISEASRIDFAYRIASRNAAYVRVLLDSGEGPMGTRDYRIALEAIPVEGGKTFIHLTYSYGYDLFGRVAMAAYLATKGRDKIGFTAVGPQARPVGGLRGVMERNTMRYYLAIEAFLGALAVPPLARFEKRIGDWFAATERYPRQLHELDRAVYLDMKRGENLRQQAAPG